MIGGAKLKLWLMASVVLLGMVSSVFAKIICVNSVMSIVFLQAGTLASDLTGDGAVDFEDIAALTDWWLWVGQPGEIPEDISEDGTVNFDDFAILAADWREELPQTPPTPDPMTWAVEPYATSPYSIAMVATTATSTDGSGVEYYFEDFYDPNYNSDWLSFAEGEEAMWEDKGLGPQGSACYRVKARNKSNLSETDLSVVRCATTPPEDETPPTPNPMTWETEPYKISSTSIRMVATTAEDDSGVEYYFECTSHPVYNSDDWQDSPVYEVTSLAKGLYTFVVRARDKSPNYNTTFDSQPAIADLKPPIPDPMWWASGGEPQEVHLPPYGTWDYAATMTAYEATDESGGVQYYFQCNDSRYSSGGEGDPGGTKWRTDRTYTVLVGQQGRTFKFRVYARDLYGNETGPSAYKSMN